MVDKPGCSQMSELQFFEGNSSSRKKPQPALFPVSNVKTYISPAGKITKRNNLEIAVYLGSRYNREEFYRHSVLGLKGFKGSISS